MIEEDMHVFARFKLYIVVYLDSDFVLDASNYEIVSDMFIFVEL